MAEALPPAAEATAEHVCLTYRAWAPAEPRPPRPVAVLRGGQSNVSLLLAGLREHWVLRIPREAQPDGVCRRRELCLHRLAAAQDLAPAVVWAEPERGLLLTRYIAQGGKQAQEKHPARNDADRASTIARLLRALHALDPEASPGAPGLAHGNGGAKSELAVSTGAAAPQSTSRGTSPNPWQSRSQSPSQNPSPAARPSAEPGPGTGTGTGTGEHPSIDLSPLNAAAELLRLRSRPGCKDPVLGLPARAARRLERVTGQNLEGNPTPVICHNDLLQANRLWHRGRLVAIDWEYARPGDPYFDLAVVASELDRHQHGALLGAYLQRQATTAEQQRFMDQLVLYTAIAACWYTDYGSRPAAEEAVGRLLRLTRDPAKHTGKGLGQGLGLGLGLGKGSGTGLGERPGTGLGERPGKGVEKAVEKGPELGPDGAGS